MRNLKDNVLMILIFAIPLVLIYLLHWGLWALSKYLSTLSFIPVEDVGVWAAVFMIALEILIGFGGTILIIMLFIGIVGALAD